MTEYRQQEANIIDCSNIPVTATSLQLSRCSKLTSLAGVQNALNLIEVTLINCSNLTDCSQLANLNNLTSLDISWCKKIKDFSFIKEIKTVQKVCLIANLLTEVADFSSLNQLLLLDLRSNIIKEINIKRLSKSIRILNLSDNQIQEVPNLHDFNIKELDLSSNKIQDVNAGKLCKSLRVLDLGDNRIYEQPDLCKFQIKKLCFSKNKIQDANTHKLSKSIEILNLKDNQIQNFLDLHEFNIKELDLSSNRIQYVKVDMLCKSLEVLNMGNNENLKDFSFLKYCPQLNKLYLCNNGNTTPITPLLQQQDTLSLTELNFEYNETLTDFSFLKQCTQLTELQLSYYKNFNDAQCHNISNITSLKVLDISNTSITSLTPLIPLKDIVQLQISNCKINDANQLACLCGMKNLQRIECNGNKMCSQKQYIEILAQSLPISIVRIKTTNEFIDSNVFKVKRIQLNQTQITSISLTFTEHFYPSLEILDQCSKVTIESCKNVDLTMFSTHKFENLEEIQIKNCSQEGMTFQLVNQPKLKVVVVEQCVFENLTIQNNKQLTDLSLCQTQIQNALLLDGVNQIKTLNISKSNFENIQQLKNFTQLESLNISYNKLANEKIDFLQALKQIRNLNFEGTQIENCLALQNLLNLEEVDLSDNCIKLINFQGLEKLKILNISKNQIYDILSLSYLKNIKQLDVSNNKIANIDSIQNLIQLKVLKVGGNQIESCGVLENLVNIEEVDISGNSIKTVNFSINSKLKILNISNNQVSNISSLSSLKNIEQLNVSSNNISQIQQIKNLSNIKQLNVSNNQITDISKLSSLKNIEQLDVSRNKISQLNQLLVLQQLKKLRTLSCFGNEVCNYVIEQFLEQILPQCIEQVCFNSEQNEISVLTQQMLENEDLFRKLQFTKVDFRKRKVFETAQSIVIADCKNINQMQFSETKFNDLEEIKIKSTQIPELVIQGQPKLEHIVIQSCNCCQIKLNQLNLVTYLKLSHNKIKNIQSLSNLIQLKELILAGNLIQIISPISKLQQIESVDFSYNCITNLSQLLVLKQLDYLKNISYFNNPMCRLARKTKKLSKKQNERIEKMKQEKIIKLLARILPLSMKEIFVFKKDQNEIISDTKQMSQAKKVTFKTPIKIIQQSAKYEQQSNNYQEQVYQSNKECKYILSEQQKFSKLVEQSNTQQQKQLQTGELLRQKYKELKNRIVLKKSDFQQNQFQDFDRKLSNALQRSIAKAQCFLREK